jgi:hypothetical protein
MRFWEKKILGEYYDWNYSRDEFDQALKSLLPNKRLFKNGG